MGDFVVGDGKCFDAFAVVIDVGEAALLDPVVDDIAVLSREHPLYDE